MVHYSLLDSALELVCPRVGITQASVYFTADMDPGASSTSIRRELAVALHVVSEPSGVIPDAYEDGHG